MEFCDNCFNFLFIKEIKENNLKKIIYYCKKCNFIKDCNNNRIMLKKYNNEKKIMNNTTINKLKTKDITLPTIKSKCNFCKKININKYEIKYYNNSYHKNIICINCYKNKIN
jgi:DNA-directed RNA polymerase subunit M/transcription elongation factor TFIIS